MSFRSRSKQSLVWMLDMQVFAANIQSFSIDRRVYQIRPRSEGYVEDSRKMADLYNKPPLPHSELVLWSSIPLITTTSALIVSLSEGRETLLLCDRVDICTNEERDDVEERDPGVLGEELLRKCKRKWRGDPANLHDRHEAGLPGCMNLVEGPRASDDGHRNQIHAVLDGSDLIISSEVFANGGCYLYIQSNC